MLLELADKLSMELPYERSCYVAKLQRAAAAKQVEAATAELSVLREQYAAASAGVQQQQQQTTT